MMLPRLCLAFLLLTACKDKAPAQDDPAKPGSPTTLPGDCAKAQAEMERLDRCGAPDPELAELWRQTRANLAEPNVPPDVKALVVAGCKQIVAQASGMTCDNIDSSRRRRPEPPRLTAECEKAKELSERLAKCEKLNAEERETARKTWEVSKDEILSAAKVLAESGTDPEIRSAAIEALRNNCTKILADLAMAADTCP
jgi:hypothetical protein